MKTVIYVEESENDFARTIVKRKDIRLVLVRFLNCLSFSNKHLEQTKDIPTFILDKKAPLAEESNRFEHFIHQTCKTVDAFYNDSEFNQVLIQKIANSLGLPGALTETQANTVRDKLQMKQYIRSIGLSCPDFSKLNSKHDAEICADKWGFPFIIKWRTGVSSIEVYCVQDKENLEQLKLDFESGQYMAEKFQPDKIWCVDAIVQNGSVITNLLTWLPYTNLSFAETKAKFAQIAVGYPQKSWKFEPRSITQRIISGLGLGSGYLHLELFVSVTGEAKVCEFAWRTPGDHMMQNFTALYGRCIEDYLIDVLLGEKVDELSNVHKCVSDVFLPKKDGVIRKISDISDFCHLQGFINGQVYYKQGEELISKHKYTDSCGWIQLSAKDVSEMLKRIDDVYNTFELVIEEDYNYEKSDFSN